jgi:hypothetical protein
MPKRISKLIKPHRWISGGWKDEHPCEEGIALLSAKIDLHQSEVCRLVEENTRLRKALKECWRLAKGEPCGEKVTSTVIGALTTPKSNPVT